MFRLVFLAAALAFAVGSVSWLVAADRSRRRAVFLTRSGAESEQATYWRSLAAKDSFAGLLFLMIGVAVLVEGIKPDPSLADAVLLAGAAPLIMSLIWVRRFRRAAGFGENDAELAQRSREHAGHDDDLAGHMAERLGCFGVETAVGLVLQTLYRPAEGNVGGDFIGCAEHDDRRVTFLIGDITGHGIGPALEALRIKDLLMAALKLRWGPSEALRLANAHLVQTQDYMATVFAAVFDGLQLSYASAGHLPGVIVNGNGNGNRLLPATGPILGAFADADFQETAFELRLGESVVLYTDGLVEAYGERGGLDDNEIPVIVSRGDFNLLHEIVNERQPMPLRDDIAAMHLSWNTPPTRPAELGVPAS